MGTTEEAGKAVGGIIDALKNSPALLIILILNCALVALMFYTEHQHSSRSEKVVHMIETLFQRCLKQMAVEERNGVR